MKAMRFALLCLLAVVLAGITGCGRNSGDEGEYYIYYLNKEKTKIIPEPYELKAKQEDTLAVIEELLLRLTAELEDVDYMNPIPKEVSLLDYKLEESLLTLYFSAEYLSLDKIDEAISRAAIVRTMLQAEGVECLSFYAGDAPLADHKGNPVGIMTNDSFIENPGEQINSIETAELTLYFANKKGNGLVTETREVHYSSNISMEKLVMEHLLEGPESKDAQSAIPEGAKLMNVSVLEGVCYVSLDENFMKQNYNIEEAVVIYSIVNSLSELSAINKVQISVNGDSQGVYREKLELNTVYERNLDYLDESVRSQKDREEDGVENVVIEEGESGD